MGYRVSGILKLPDGAPANNAEIEFISRKNFSPLVQELKSNIRCSATGAYDVTLEYGEYAVIVYPGGTYPAALGTIILAADTVAGQDLPTLLQQADWQPATPEYIQQIAAWLANANASAASSAASASAAKVSETNSKSSEIAAEAYRSEAAASAALAGDIVVASAIPLPDVWAPLSDSLRLITGYGRDVLVGSDVLARMVNFSRSTTATYTGKDGLPKTAAANEPRFEKAGLLIEGQSTNLFLYPKSPDSYTWFGRGDNTSYIKITDGVRITGVGYYSYHAVPVIAGQKYTFSVTCKVLSGTLERVGLEGNVYVMLGSGLTPEDGTVRLSGTVTPNVNGHATIVYYPTQNSVVEFTDVQLEALPYATSPIYADGAAATRVADIASLPQSLNLGESQLGFSLAVDFDSVNSGPYRVISLSDYSAVMGDGANIYIRHAGREIGPLPAQLGKRNRLAYTVDLSGVITACINGAQITAPSRNAGAPGSNEKIMFGSHINTALNLALEGHLRDLKIWTKTPLTADQLKVASA